MTGALRLRVEGFSLLSGMKETDWNGIVTAVIWFQRRVINARAVDINEMYEFWGMFEDTWSLFYTCTIAVCFVLSEKLNSMLFLIHT